MTRTTRVRVSFAGLIALLIAMAITTVLAARADAHTPSGGMTCEGGVWAKATNYSSRDTNTIRVQVDGTVIEHTFTTNAYEALPIPNDGQDHIWQWSISTTNPNPAYGDGDGGNIRCGEPPVTEEPTPTPTDEPTPSVPPTDEPTPSVPPTDAPPTTPAVPTPPVTPTVPPTEPPGPPAGPCDHAPYACDKPTPKPPHHPPTVGPPPATATRVCIGANTIKVTHGDGSVDYVFADGRCQRVPKSAPPVKEEGF